MKAMAVTVGFRMAELFLSTSLFWEFLLQEEQNLVVSLYMERIEDETISIETISIEKETLKTANQNYNLHQDLQYGVYLLHRHFQLGTKIELDKCHGD